MKWTDINEIAIALSDTLPEIDPARVNFVDLMAWVKNMPDFHDPLGRCNEKILEAIQQAWIDEKD